jgi:hypothetical protein
MTTGEREQLGWEIGEDVFASFRQRVRARWGAEKPFVNRELEDAIRAFLTEHGATSAGEQAESDTTGIDTTRTKQDLLSRFSTSQSASG